MMTAYDLAKQEQARIEGDAILVARAVLAVLGDKRDDISEREAFALYDRGWIIDRTQRGMLQFTRKGATSKSAKVYSRFKIEALKRAEKNLQDAFDNADNKALSLQQFIKSIKE